MFPIDLPLDRQRGSGIGSVEWARPDLNWGPTGVSCCQYEPVALTELLVLEEL